MIALARLLIFGLIGLSIIYWALSIYSRSLRREKLEKRWLADHPDDLESRQRSEFIEEGMAEYETSLRRRLILLVYVVPVIAIIVIFFVVN